MRFRRLAATAASVTTLAALAGCSGDAVIGPGPNSETSKPATTILSDAIAAMRSAKTVHLKGTIVGLFFDADVGGGSFTGSVNSGGKVFDVVYIAGPGGDASKARIFIKASSTVWATASTPAIGACVGDKWLTLDPAVAGAGVSNAQGADQLTADAGQLGNLAGFADALGNSPGVLTKGSVGPLNGTSVIAISNDSGAVVFIAVDGPPYISRISSTSNGTPQNLDFTNWNASVAFKAPSGANPLNTVLASCPGATATAPSASPSPSP